MRPITGLAVFAIIGSTVIAQPVVRIQQGPVNGVLIEQNDQRLSVYGWEADEGMLPEQVLLTHGRRDVIWKAMPAVRSGASVVAPNRERFGLENPQDFWKAFGTARFHDYAQQTTRVPAAPLPVTRWVNDGDTVEWQGLTFRAVETPGYTRGSLSWITQIDHRKIAFTGDLICGDGRMQDLYSFQDAIPEVQIRGYHGYGARLADLVTSLDRIAAENPDQLIPVRGAVIDDPLPAIERLKTRVRALYRNYLSTNALHWYFKEDRMRFCGQRVLGTGAEITLMPYSHHEQTPAWILENSTSRLLISDTGNGFLLDCGYQRVIDDIRELIDQKVIRRVEGIFVTHYHDDHTDMVQAAADEFQCPVYAMPQYAELLARPEAYHLPAMTANPIRNIQILPDGHHRKWHEFDLTFSFFPGQTYYHGAVLAEKPEERAVYFVGDSFAPSGFDDYCVLNRNLVHEDDGYLLCLKKLREVGKPFWLVNEHIPYVFSFTETELDYLEERFRERIAIMRDLFPWDDPNYGIDEQWAVFLPHGATVKSGETFAVELLIRNHSPSERSFRVVPHIPDGWTISAVEETVQADARASCSAHFQVTAGAGSGPFLLTADVISDGMEFREWAEAVITIP